ncbi:Rab-GAP TBC domain-containing protein [Pseudoscourfieldia marina]
MPVPVPVQTPPMPPQTPSASSESESESESHAASGAVQWSVQSLSALPLLVTSDSIRTRASMILSRSVSTFASAITHGVDEVLDVAAASLENVSHAAASAVTNVAGHAAEAAAAAIRKAQQAQTFIKDREGLRARAAASDPAANVDVQIGCTCYEDAPPELRSRLWMAVAQIERGGDDLVLKTSDVDANSDAVVTKTRQLWESISQQDVPPIIDHLSSFELLDDDEFEGVAHTSDNVEEEVDDEDDSIPLRTVNSAAHDAKPSSSGAPPPNFRTFSHDDVKGTRAPPSYDDALACAKHLSPELVECITRDLHRTFPEHPLLRAKHGQTALLRVLTAFAAYDPETNYCQGMGFLAGMLLTRVTEPDAYMLLCRYMRGARGLYGSSMADVAPLLDKLEAVATRRQPELMLRLHQLGISPAIYASSWFLTCFACSMPLAFAERVMDMCLLSNEPLIVLLRVALAVLGECALLYDLQIHDPQMSSPPSSSSSPRNGDGDDNNVENEKEDAFARAARTEGLGVNDAFEAAVKALKDSPATWEMHRMRAVLGEAVHDTLTLEEAEAEAERHLCMARERAERDIVEKIVQDAVNAVVDEFGE